MTTLLHDLQVFVLAIALGAIAGAIWKTWQLQRQQPAPKPTVRLTLMDVHERERVAEMDVEARYRRPEVSVRGERYLCSRRTRDGFIYRKALTEKDTAWPRR